MAMDFFESQERAKRNTGMLVVLFVLAVLGTVAGVHVVLAVSLGGGNLANPSMLPIAAGSVGVIVLVGTLDTKGPEFAYVRDRMQALGMTTTVIDAGILGDPLGIVPDIDHAEAARYGGTTIEALQKAGSRGKAVACMRDALRVLLLKL